MKPTQNYDEVRRKRFIATERVHFNQVEAGFPMTVRDTANGTRGHEATLQARELAWIVWRLVEITEIVEVGRK